MPYLQKGRNIYRSLSMVNSSIAKVRWKSLSSESVFTLGNCTRISRLLMGPIHTESITKSLDPFLLTSFNTSLWAVETFARIEGTGQRFDAEGTRDLVDGISDDNIVPGINICPTEPSRYGPLMSLSPQCFPSKSFLSKEIYVSQLDKM